MGKELNDGLMMGNSFFMIDDKEQRFPFYARVIQVLAILIGSWGFIYILQESIDIPTNTLEIDLAIIICTGIMVLLCLFPSFNLVKQFFVLLFYALFFYSRLPRLRNGFYIIENLVLDRFSKFYHFNSFRYEADYTTEVADATLLVIMILIPMVAVLAITIIKNKFVYLCCVLLLTPVTLSLLCGIIPSEKYLFAYIALFLYISRPGFTSFRTKNKEQLNRMHKISNKAAIWLSLIGVVIFSILKLFVTEDRYNNISQINEMKIDIQTTYLNFTLDEVANKVSEGKIFKEYNSVGGLSGGELGNVGEVKYTNSEQLVVTTNVESAREGIYLKGYVGSVYTGDSWEGHSKVDEIKYEQVLNKLSNKEFQPENQAFNLFDLMLNVNETSDTQMQNFESSALPNDIYKGKMKIEYKEANQKFIYAPYFTDYELLDQIYYEQDLYPAPSIEKGQYDFDYYFSMYEGDMPYDRYVNKTLAMGDYAEGEKLYRDYVYQVYTNLPKEGIRRLKEDFSEKNLPTDVTNVTQKIEYVKNYLAQNTSYTLAPGKLPEGKDFVEYFLYENHKGYCAHYASSATLMLRAMGVPARYVEGYAIANQTEEFGVGYYNEDIAKVIAYTDNGIELRDFETTQISVKDSSAHAWVEVYIDGCGWLPVEFTPGSTVEYNNSAIDSLTQIGNLVSGIKNDKVVPTLKPATPTPAKVDEKNKTVENQNEQTTSTKSDDRNEKSTLDRAFIVAFILLAIAAVGMLLIKIIKKSRRRRTQNHNERAISQFVEIEKILSIGKGLPTKRARLEDCVEYIIEHNQYMEAGSFNTCMEIVTRARFAKGNISIEELNELGAFKKKLYNQVYKGLPFIKKINLKINLLM